MAIIRGSRRPMLDVDEFLVSAGRSQFGGPRTSLWNTSFLAEYKGRFWIDFLRTGQVILDFTNRVPRHYFENILFEMNSEGNFEEGDTLFISLEELLRDAESAVYHWVADQAGDQKSDVSPELSTLLGDLSSILNRTRTLAPTDYRAFRTYVDSACPDLTEALLTADAISVATIGASVSRRKRGRKRSGDPATNVMMDSLLDDWVRHTGRPVTEGGGPDSARSFFLTVIELMAKYPPRTDLCPIRSEAAALIPKLRLKFDKPLESAIRSRVAEYS